MAITAPEPLELWAARWTDQPRESEQRRLIWDRPSALAQELFPGYRPAPHLAPIDEAYIDALNGKVDRIVISLPPQVGKSTTAAEAGPLWWLHVRPRSRVTVASYASKLAIDRGEKVRDTLITSSRRLNLELTAGSRAAAEWDLTTGGGMKCMGVGGGLTGFGSDLMIVDDPHKDREEANSRTMRQKVWGWYQSTVESRMAPGAPLILIMCMTGDTPVLMGNGTEKQLRDVRPGDTVATYENGTVTTSTVRNWANQGPDAVYSLRMKSGTVVRANARHPFLTVDENGVESWRRLRDLNPGDAIVRAMHPEGVCSESNARLTGASPPPSARACACSITAKPDGQQVIVRRPPTRGLDGVSGSKAAMGSRPTSMTVCLPSKMVGARSAGPYPKRSTDRSTGLTSSALITTTTQELCEACSATTATSSLAAGTRPPSSVPPLSTWSIGKDEVESIELNGCEDVFDIEVERTHNFIANGLTTHNTRWHEDDLTARVLTNEGRVEEGGRWRVISIPAIAEGKDAKGNLIIDPLGRQPGDPLTNPKLPGADRATLLEFWTQKRKSSGPREWPALYQQRPAPPEGAVWQFEWINMARRETREVPTTLKTIVAVDPSGTAKQTSDECGVVVVARSHDGHGWVLDDRSKIATPAEWGRVVCQAAIDWDCAEIVAEQNQGYEMVQDVMRNAWRELQRSDPKAAELPMPRVVKAHSRIGKVLRAEPVAAMYEQLIVHHVGDALDALEDQMLTWTGDGDSPDRVDALVHGLTYLLKRGGGPARSQSVAGMRL